MYCGSIVNRRNVIAFSILTVAFILMVLIAVFIFHKKETASAGIVFQPPDHWSINYTENVTDYNKVFSEQEVNWSTVLPEDDSFTTVTINESEVGATFVSIADKTSIASMTEHDRELAQLTENEAWTYISNGLFTEYPTTSFSANVDKLRKLQQSNTKTITVKCWYWEDPKDDTNMSKVSKTKTFAVNSSVACLFEHAFEDIYNDPAQPVLNLGDTGMGTWVLRGKNHDSSRTMSSHSLGCAIDINPSTGSFYVNGTWYGNAYGQKAMPESIWMQLPECHKKYHVLYDGSPIVVIFKSYGFCWGGDWTSGTDSMHLSFIGDGSSARAKGIQNYADRLK